MACQIMITLDFVEVISGLSSKLCNNVVIS